MNELETKILNWLWDQVDAHPEQTRCARRAFRIQYGVPCSDQALYDALHNLVDGGFVEVDEENDFGFVYFRPIKRLVSTT